MDGFQRELLRRLPLAQGVLRVVGYALDSGTLASLFAAHRGRCYEDILTFDRLVALVMDALTVYRGSGNQAFCAAQARGELPVAEQNVYGKLGRLPEALSIALLSSGAARLRQILPMGRPVVELPASLRRWKAVAVDGKKIKKAAKRLKALRGVAGQLLGGKLLVALDVACGLAMAMNADPDGERNDVPLVPGLVAQVRALVSEAILWIADRQFGNLEVPSWFCAREGDHFLVRCPCSLKLEADPLRSAERSLDGEGRTVIQEWGWIGSAKDPRRRYVRRITLVRPGEDAIILITDLIDETDVPARDLLEAYRHRWDIERMFQEVTEVFHLQTLIGSSPRAMIFQSTLCFLLYNAIQVMRAYVADDGNQKFERVSGEKLFWDVRDQLTTWANLGSRPVAVEALSFGEGDRAATSAAMSFWLARTLRGSWNDRYLKAPRKRKRPFPAGTPAKVPSGHGGHSSTWRILQAARAGQGGPRS